MRDALLATVTEEVAAVQAFESLLVDEEKALIAAQPLPALPAIIEHKTALTERISALEKARDEQLNALGFPGGFVGMEAAAADDAAIAAQWALLDRRRPSRETGQQQQRRADPHAHGIQPQCARRVAGRAVEERLLWPGWPRARRLITVFRILERRVLLARRAPLSFPALSSTE